MGLPEQDREGGVPGREDWRSDTEMGCSEPLSTCSLIVAMATESFRQTRDNDREERRGELGLGIGVK